MTKPESVPTTSAAAEPADSSGSQTVVQAMAQHLQEVIARNGGWIGFDTFMQHALFAPGLGYYNNDLPKFGVMPGRKGAPASDFVTAPELSPLFGQAVARQVAQALQATGTVEVWEFGAGTGALALQLLDALGDAVVRYTIVDLSGTLRGRQAETLAAHRHKVRWLQALPDRIVGVIVGNEVLDAMPVQLLARTHGTWQERGVRCEPGVDATQPVFAWSDRPTGARPPVEVPGVHDFLTEIHPQAEAFIRTIGESLEQGAAFFMDYGFPEAEYYHPQRHMGTVMCHQAHRADPDPLVEVGVKDITAHVNFTGIAVAAQEAGMELLGYTSQAHFLLNCGLAEAMEQSPLEVRVMANKLLMEHEMGELFKVIGLVKGAGFDALGFSRGDRSHRL